MTPWPWHAFIIDCALPPDLASTLLASQVAPTKRIAVDEDKPFHGKVECARFEVSGIIRHRNAFLTIVTGTIGPAASGSQVHVRLRPSLLVHAVAFGHGVAGLVGSIFAVSVMRQHLHPVIWLFPVAMAAGTYAMATPGFWSEARLQERMLRDVFKTP